MEGTMMFVVANRFKVNAGYEAMFEDLFLHLGAGAAVARRSASAMVFLPEAGGLPEADALEGIIRLRPDLIVSHPTALHDLQHDF
jgi:hypothetical protein